MNSMSHKMRLSQVVPLGFLAILIVMIANGLLFRWTVNSLTTTNSLVMHTYRIQTSLQEIERLLIDIQLGERGFIITRKDNFLADHERDIKLLETKLEQLRNLLKDNPIQIQNLAEIESLAEKSIEVLGRNIRISRSGKAVPLENLVAGKQSMEELRNKIGEMLKLENELLTVRQKAVVEAEQISSFISLGGTIVGVLGGGFIILFVIRKVVKPIHEVANMITSSSSEIAATVTQHEQVAVNQAGSVSQTTTTMDELEASSQLAAEQAETAADNARQVAQLVVHLSDQIRQINDITNLVADLANQTNMLALNAAVEAVRAGEHGKGFAVVAAEIRKLADESKKSAQKISILTLDIQRLTHADWSVDQTGGQFESIVTAINNIVFNSQQISMTTKQQAVAIQQVAGAMNLINQGAAQTAIGITQTKISTQQLNEAACTLKVVV
jgi:methyl-accepting chemotaxis protein